MRQTPARGFTLIEVLIGSGILALTAGAVVSFGRTAIRAHDLAGERTQAYQLVSEGLEIARQIRDTSYIDQEVNEWNSNFSAELESFSPIWDAATRRFKFIKNNVAEPAISEGVETINLDGLNFARKVVFTPPPSLFELKDSNNESIENGVSTNAIKVTVEVAWESYGNNWQVAGSTLLTNWKPGY